MSMLKNDSYPDFFMQQLYTLQMKNKFCDISFKTGQDQVFIHRVVLLASSPNFPIELLESQLVSESDGIQVIDCDGVPKDILQVVVYFMYSGCLDVGSHNKEHIYKVCSDFKLTEALKVLHEHYPDIKFPNTHNAIDKRLDIETEADLFITARNANRKSVRSLNLDRDNLSHKEPKKKKICTRQTPIHQHKHFENKSLVKTNVRTLQNRQGKYEEIESSKIVKSSPQKVKQRLTKFSHKRTVNSRTTAKTKLKVTEKVNVPAQDNEHNTFSLSHKSNNSIEIINDENQSQICMDKDKINKCGKNKRDEDLCDESIANKDFYDKSRTNEDLCDEKRTNEDLCDEKGTNEDLCDEKRAHEDLCDDNRTNDDLFDEKRTNEDLCDENKTTVITKKTRRKRGLKDNKVKKEKLKPKQKYKRRKKQYPCRTCEKILTNRERLLFHEFSKHGIMSEDTNRYIVPCKEKGCSYVTSSKHNLKSHMASKHGAERPHICEFCGKRFKLPHILAAHLNLHTGLKVWRCDTCGETFNQQSGLGIHIKRHHIGESSFGELCHLCSEKFLLKSDLAWHLFRVHDQPLPEKYKAHTCTICNYTTKSKQDLMRHTNAHEGLKLFTCSICQKRCSSKTELRRHMSFHGEKKHRCEFEGCSYATTESIGLAKHIKLMHTHKDYKPWPCPVCPYKTGLKGNIDKHIRSVHNLDVVTKHTLKMKMKYANFESGDVITKDGQLVASAKERSALQAQYKAEYANSSESLANRNSSDKVKVQPIRGDLTDLQDSNIDTGVKDMSVTDVSIGEDLSQRDLLDINSDTDILECDKPVPIENEGVLNNVVVDQFDSVDGERAVDYSSSTNHENGIRELTPLGNYLYLHSSQERASDPVTAVSVIAEDVTISLESQISTASGHYSSSEDCITTTSLHY